MITGVAYDGLMTTTVNPLNQIKTERRNALGELIAVTDNLTGGGVVESVIHLGDVEYLKTSNETRRYLPGGLVISHRSTGTGARRWVLMDHQGSADRIVNRFGMMQKFGNVPERMGFEPFGWRRHQNGIPLSRQEVRAYASPTTRRGYTGHEHYDKRALIHMNGRVYDPQIGRFVSADPFVQFGDETQSANRYS